MVGRGTLGRREAQERLETPDQGSGSGGGQTGTGTRAGSLQVLVATP